ncbi:MAG: hypothetical protein IPL33_13925 [Sphingobacteriales bacterium]|nr:hypothetical protein [Sphingobacteriales bacterium]
MFANSIIDATPLSDVKIALVSRSNMNFKTANTDRNGVAVFTDLKAQFPDFKAAMITAEKAGDFNYMHLDRTTVNTARFDVAGKYSNEAKYDAFIYGDREMYRPGETIHTNTIIVHKSDWTKAANMPIRITLLQPNGKEYRSIRKNLNAESAANADFELPAASYRQLYRRNIYGQRYFDRLEKPQCRRVYARPHQGRHRYRQKRGFCSAKRHTERHGYQSIWPACLQSQISSTTKPKTRPICPQRFRELFVRIREIYRF